MFYVIWNIFWAHISQTLSAVANYNSTITYDSAINSNDIYLPAWGEILIGLGLIGSFVYQMFRSGQRQQDQVVDEIMNASNRGALETARRERLIEIAGILSYMTGTQVAVYQAGQEGPPLITFSFHTQESNNAPEPPEQSRVSQALKRTSAAAA